MSRINSLIILTLFPLLICGCVIKRESCNDGIQNLNETEIDCGGICPPCEKENCYDGIQNQNELDIDCGGICPPCPPVVSPCNINRNWATIDSQSDLYSDIYVHSLGVTASNKNSAITVEFSTQPLAGKIYTTDSFSDSNKVNVIGELNGTVFYAEPGQDVHVNVKDNIVDIEFCDIVAKSHDGIMTELSANLRSYW